MYERIKILYKQGEINKVMLDRALTKGWISDEEYNKILGGEVDAII